MEFMNLPEHCAARVTLTAMAPSRAVFYRRTAEISPPGPSSCCGRVLTGRP